MNKLGLVVAWACDTANVSDTTFQPLIKQYEEEMIVCGDTGFHPKQGDPKNLKVCRRGTWNQRMMVETVLSILTLVDHFKRVMHGQWAYFQMRLAYTMTAFNLLVQWLGLSLMMALASFQLLSSVCRTSTKG